MRSSTKTTTPTHIKGVEQCSSALVVSPTGGIVDLSVSPSPPTPERRSHSATIGSSRGVSRNGASTAASALFLGGESTEATITRFQRVLDKATGKHYYYDKETKETFWTLAEGLANLPLTTAVPEDPRKRRKTYGLPPTDVEAVSHNQGAVVWWKNPAPTPPATSQTSPQRGGKEKAPRTETTDGTAKGGGGDGVLEVSAAGEEDMGGARVATENCTPPKTIGFVVYRYRLDGREWHRKGATSVDDAEAVSTPVNALTNGLVYRFTVAARTVEGDSAESEPSVAVRPNEPLPEGWKEKLNAITGKAEYTNVKTGQTSLERPECNPYFVETDLFLKFTPEETEALSEAFRTRAEIQSSTLVSIDDIMDMLPRIGESLHDAEVVKRLKEGGWEGAAGARDVASVTYRQFLVLLWSIKGPKSTRRSIGRRLWDTIVASVAPRSVPTNKLALIEQDPVKRMGNWEKLIHPIARRPYFVHKHTGLACWTVPADVKFFLNEKLREELLKTTFSEEELAGLQKAFAKMDLDGNGTIDADELALVLKCFGEAVPPGRLKALIREVDHDGSECIDFEEFTVMMSAVKKGNASRGWGRINRHLQGDHETKFNGLKGQFHVMKARKKTGAIGSDTRAAGGDGNGGANHGKFCLCGCRGVTPADRNDKVVYKGWRTKHVRHHEVN